MKLYHYNELGQLHHVSEAMRLTVANADGVFDWSIPAFATTHPAPAVDGREYRFVRDLAHLENTFVGGEWVEYVEPPAPEPVPLTQEQLVWAVNDERDRRISAGFIYSGVVYQSRELDLLNITSSMVTATLAKISGAQANDFRWHGGHDDFTWISASNDEIRLDVNGMIGLGMAAMEHKRNHMYSARYLKDKEPIPLNYIDDKYWPSN